MNRNYEKPLIEIEKINVNVITTSDWELPKTEWETDEIDPDW